jgi:cysteinyl-tRNA synthetase, unknown class
MRALVHEISQYARERVPAFIVIAQNGEELLTLGDSAAAPVDPVYASAVDGLAREDLFYGYAADNVMTPATSTAWMLSYLDLARTLGIDVWSIDYCWSAAKIEDARARSAAHEFVSFQAPSRLLDVVPEDAIVVGGFRDNDVDILSDVRNFLYLIDPWRFDSSVAFIAALASTNYDALVVDREFEGRPLSAEDVSKLKVKANGNRRIVLCYLSIGEAEDYRSYWQPSWTSAPPGWLLPENVDWPGNYPVSFWDPAWHEIVFGMLDAILDVGFDGVYLDRVDVYEELE